VENREAFSTEACMTCPHHYSISQAGDVGGTFQTAEAEA